MTRVFRICLATSILLGVSVTPGNAALSVSYDVLGGRAVVLSMDPYPADGRGGSIIAYTDSAWVFHHSYVGYAPSTSPYGLTWACVGMSGNTFVDNGYQWASDYGCGSVSVTIDDSAGTFTIMGTVHGAEAHATMTVHVSGSVSGTPTLTHFGNSYLASGTMVGQPAIAQFQFSSPQMGQVSGSFTGLSGILVSASENVYCQNPLAGC